MSLVTVISVLYLFFVLFVSPLPCFPLSHFKYYSFIFSYITLCLSQWEANSSSELVKSLFVVAGFFFFLTQISAKWKTSHSIGLAFLQSRSWWVLTRDFPSDNLKVWSPWDESSCMGIWITWKKTMDFKAPFTSSTVNFTVSLVWQVLRAWSLACR